MLKRLLYILVFVFVFVEQNAARPDNILTKAPAGLDTLDEEDYFRMLDTLRLPRQNRADQNRDTLGQPQMNLRNYVVKDLYSLHHQSFDNKWYDHIYAGAGFGVERLAPMFDGYRFRTLTTANAHVGKQISRFSDVRLSLAGGWGYQDNTELQLTQIGFRADYFYSLSTLINGYNPARRMDVSLMAGLGGMYSKLSGVGGSFAPEGYIGARLKFYTGPLGTVNVEPYIGLASDQIDISGVRNYHKYDIFYGIRFNYSCFLSNNLSKESRLLILQNRLAGDRMVDANTLESWRIPWFVEYAAGPAIPQASGGASTKTGHEVSLAVGKWFSPVMGCRITGATRMNQWMAVDDNGVTTGYNSNYVYGRLDALLNPMGFFRHFSWRAQWGGYIAFGVGIGQMTKYMPASTFKGTTVTDASVTEALRTRSESYRLGLHFFGRLSEDLQLFAEPYYMVNVYTIPYSNVNMQGMYNDKSWGVNLGMTMLIRSKKFRDPNEMDNTQNYTYRDVKGLSVGFAAGLPLLQNTAPVYDDLGTNWNMVAMAEYRFDYLNSVRLQAELLNLNVAKGVTYTDSYTDENGYTVSKTTTGMAKTNRKILLGSLDYMINLTNLCSGRFLERKVELDAFLGPTYGYVLQTKASYENFTTEMHAAHDITYDTDQSLKQSMFGFNLGLQLRAKVWDQFSVIVSPTFYLMSYKNDIPGLNTVHVGSMHYFHTINIGVQYKFNALYRNPEKLRKKRAHASEMWRLKQIEKEHKWQRKQELKQLKRQYKYGY